MFLGIYDIDEYVSIPAATHRFNSGAAYQPTSLTYSIYEEGGTTGLDENVDMTPASPFDAITGAYLARRQLAAAAGFERDKTYLVAVKATVDSVAAVELHIFQIRQKQTGDSYARLGAPNGASVSADIAAVKSETASIVADTNELQTDLTNGGRLDLLIDAILEDTGTTLDGKINAIDGIVDDILVDTAVIGAAGAGLSAIPWNAAWDAEVQSECTDALNAYDPPTKAEMDAHVPVVLPVMQGAVYTATTIQQREVRVVAGDTPTITFDLGADYSGWTAKFAAKASPDDQAYAMAVRECAWTDATAGEGYVTLSAADTAAPGVYRGEIELSLGAARLTALQFRLVVIPGVIGG